MKRFQHEQGEAYMLLLNNVNISYPTDYHSPAPKTELEQILAGKTTADRYFCFIIISQLP
jgi:hypothetical protein